MTPQSAFYSVIAAHLAYISNISTPEKFSSSIYDSDDLFFSYIKPCLFCSDNAFSNTASDTTKRARCLSVTFVPADEFI
jgi:hypothetical protein